MEQSKTFLCSKSASSYRPGPWKWPLALDRKACWFVRPPVRQVYIAIVDIHDTFIQTSTALTILHQLSEQNMQKMQTNTRIPNL